MINCFLGDALWVLFCQFLEYCFAVRCSAADTHLRLLDHVVSGVSYLTGGVFECDLSLRRSVAVLCMLYKIRCNQMYLLPGALPVLYVPVRVTRGAEISHRYTYALPRCRTSQYSRTFIPLSVSLWNDLSHPVFDGVGLAGFKSRAKAFFWPCCSLTFCLLLLSLSLLSFYLLVLWGWGLRTDWVFNRSLPALHCQTFLIIIMIIE